MDAKRRGPVGGWHRRQGGNRAAGKFAFDDRQTLQGLRLYGQILHCELPDSTRPAFGGRITPTR